VPIGIDRRFNAAPKRRRHEGPTALGIRFASDSLVEGKQDSKPRQVDGALFHSRWFTNGEKHRSHYSDIVGPLPPTAGVLVVIRDGIARSAAAAPRLAPGDYVLALARPKDLALLEWKRAAAPAHGARSGGDSGWDRSQRCVCPACSWRLRARAGTPEGSCLARSRVPFLLRAGGVGRVARAPRCTEPAAGGPRVRILLPPEAQRRVRRELNSAASATA
jgi:hypothetical protein